MSDTKKFRINLIVSIVLCVVDLIYLAADVAAPAPAFIFGMILADSLRDTYNLYKKQK